MFGTLVVQLPSDYSGGELVVTHGGKDKVFNFNGLKGCTNFHYAAFYADCQHELKKVTKGYRLCLIYNLLYTGSGSPPAPVENGFIIGQLVTAMKQWNDEATHNKGPAMMAYILEHKYCEASLSFKALKNIDRAIGDVLISACQEAKFDIYLAHVSSSESWSASHYRKKYTLEELCDESVDASHFIAPAGQPPACFTELCLDDGALVPKEKIKLGKPDEEERNEATGNEGASVERWYKYTAFILWPVKRRLMIIGCDKMTSKLKNVVLDRTTPLTGSERKENLELARDLVSSAGHTSSSAQSLLQCLLTLKENELIRDFLSGKISHYMRDKKFREVTFTLCCSCITWDIIRPSLLAMMKQADNFAACCELIHELFTLSLKNPTTVEPKLLYKELASCFVVALSSAGKKYESSTPDHGVCMLQVLQTIGDVGLVSLFFTVLASTSGSYHYYADITKFLRSQPFLEQVLAIGRTLGWELLTPGLQTIFKNASSSNITVYCDFLCKLACHEDASSPQKLACKDIMNIIINVLTAEQDLDHNVPSQSLRWGYMQGQFRDSNTTRSREFVHNILKLLVGLEYPVQGTNSVINAFLRQPNRYPLDTVVAPALEDLRSWLGDDKCRSIIPIVAYFITVIGGRKASTTKGSENWSQDVTIFCKVKCDDCKTLQKFLRDPAKHQACFKMSQVRRSHIVKQLAQLKCNTSHFTQNTGSPQTLVVNKVKQVKGKNSQEDSNEILARLHAICSPLLSAASVSGEPQPKRQKTNV